MSKLTKLRDRILRGTSDTIIHFEELRWLLRRLGFAERVRSDHHIFTREHVAEILNLQPARSLAKAYQVRQVRGVILQYNLTRESDDT